MHFISLCGDAGKHYKRSEDINQLRSQKYELLQCLCLCVCVCVCARARARVRVCNLALDIGQANHASSTQQYIIMCGLTGSTSVFHITSPNVRFSLKKLLNIKCM